MKGDVEETNSGVKKKGNWKEISEFGEEVEEAMEDSGFSEESLEDFREWRPKRGEAEADMQKETVEKASASVEGVGEESKGFKRGMKKASKKAVESGEEVKEGEKREAVNKVTEATETAARPFYVRIIDVLKAFEEKVYSFSLRFNPYYLDTEDVSANMRRKKDEYQLELNILEDEKRKQVKEKMGSKE